MQNYHAHTDNLKGAVWMQNKLWYWIVFGCRVQSPSGPLSPVDRAGRRILSLYLSVEEKMAAGDLGFDKIHCHLL